MTAYPIDEPAGALEPSVARASTQPWAPSGEGRPSSAPAAEFSKDLWALATEALTRYLNTGRRRDFDRLHVALNAHVHMGCARALRAIPGGRRNQLPDLMQEVWIHLLADDARVLRKFDPERGFLRGFVVTVAFRRARDVLRRAPVGDADVELRDVSTTDEQTALRHEARDALDKLARELDSQLRGRARPIFQELFVEGSDAAEVSERVGVTRGYVHKCAATVRRVARAWRERNLNDEG